MATKRGIAETGEDQGMKKPRTDVDGEERQEVRVLIDNYEASVIIGKQGANVKQIRTESQAFVSILKSEGTSNKERVMQVTGSVENVANALRMIAELLIRNDNERKSAEGESVVDQWTFKLLIHKSLAGAIIGRGGEIIKSIQTETTARISLSTEPIGASTEKTVTVGGTPATLHDALTRILTRIQENPIRAGTTSILYVPGQQAVAQFPGAPGPYGAPPSPYMPSPYGMPPSGPYGAPMGGPMGGGMGGPPMGQMPGQKSQKIVIPSCTAGTVIGKGGSIIREIKQQSGTTISVAAPESKDGTERVVTITGSEQGIQTAIYLIRQRVESFVQPAY